MRVCLSAWLIASAIFPFGQLRRRALVEPGGGSAFVHAIFGLAAVGEQLFLHRDSSWIPLCATVQRVEDIRLQLTSIAPPSTITIESCDAATTMSMSL